MLNAIKLLFLVSLGLLHGLSAQGQTTSAAFSLSAVQKQRANITTQPLGTVAQTGTPHEGEGVNALQLPGIISTPLDGLEVINAPVSGVIQAILVMPSQPVRAGQPLIRLYSQQILQWQRDFLHATTQAQLSSKKLARDQALFDDGIIAKNRLQETESLAAQNRIVASENQQMLRLTGMSPAAIDSLRKQQTLSPTITINANTAGTILEYTANTGQYVEAGTPVGKIIRQDKNLWTELRASRSQAGQIHPGDRITFAQCTDEASVTAVSPQLDADNQTLLILGTLTQAATCLQPNQYVDATVYTRRTADQSWAVPSSAEIRHSGKPFVFIEKPDGFYAVPVEILARTDTLLTIRPIGSVLNADALIAISGTVALKGRWLGIGAAEVPADGGGQ